MGCEASKPEDNYKVPKHVRTSPHMKDAIKAKQKDNEESPDINLLSCGPRGLLRDSNRLRVPQLSRTSCRSSIISEQISSVGSPCSTAPTMPSPEELLLPPMKVKAVHTPVPDMGGMFKKVKTDMQTGGLCLMHFPGKKHAQWLRDADCDYIITLQKNQEGAQDVHKLCNKYKFHWIQIDFWKFFHQGLQDKMAECVHRVVELLRSGKNIMVHCAAGIHRTGMFVYAVLRMLGHTPRSAVLSLKHLRETTYARVGAHRIQGIETLLSETFPHPSVGPIPDEFLPPQTQSNA